VAREEAQGLLQRERVALEGGQVTLKQWDEEVSRLNGELNQLSVSHEDLRQAIEEQEATVLGLQQAAEATCKALEAEKKQVEGESLFVCLLLVGSARWRSCGRLRKAKARWRSCGRLRKAGSLMASRLRALSGHVTRHMRRALHLGVQKALGVVASHYQVDLEVISTGYIVPVGVDDEVAMNRADALTAPAADILAEDFTNFLFPDAPAAGGPKPEDHWAFVPLMFLMLAFEPCGLL
jgi:hypothetical protein